MELGVGAGLGEHGVTDVVGDLEVRGVDPEGPAQLQRREHDALAEARQQVQAAADVGEEVVVAGRLPLAHHHGADRHVAVPLLVRQERRVERRQPVHMALRQSGPLLFCPRSA